MRSIPGTAPAESESEPACLGALLPALALLLLGGPAWPAHREVESPVAPAVEVRAPAVGGERKGPAPGDREAAIRRDQEASDFFQLREPRAGETWCAGRRYTIRWNPAHPSFQGGSVRLELQRWSASFGREIVAATENDGELRWRVPSSLEPAGDYRIFVARHRDEGDPFMSQPTAYSDEFAIGPCSGGA